MANVKNLRGAVVATDQVEVVRGKERKFSALSTLVTYIQGAITALGSITATQVTGNLVGQHRHSVAAHNTAGAITLTSGIVRLTATTGTIALTKAAPTAGDELYIVDNAASGTAAHTITLPAGVTWDGTNDVATFDAPGEALHVIALSATRFFVLENIGTVSFS